MANELQPDERKEAEAERTLAATAKTLEVDTVEASDAFYGIFRELRPQPTDLPPSGNEEGWDWIAELEKQSSGFRAGARDLNFQMKMPLSKDGEGQKVTGVSGLELNAGHLELSNRGAVQAHLGLDEVHVEAQLAGGKTGFSGAAKRFSAGQLTVDTHGQPSSIRWGDTRIELPGNLAGQVQKVSAHLTASDTGDSELEVSVGKTHLSGEGQVVVETQANKFSVPAAGNVTLDQCEISAAKLKAADSAAITQVTPGNISIDGVKAGSVKVGNLTTALDEQGSGYVYLNDVFVSGDDLIRDFEQLPEATRQNIPTGFLKGRKLKASVKVKVEKGLLDPKTAEFASYDLDEKDVDTSAWTEWSSWDQWLRSGLIGAASQVSFKGMNVTDGRLCMALGVGPFSYPIPLTKAPQEAVQGEKLSLPVLLHHYTGAHWGGRFKKRQ